MRKRYPGSTYNHTTGRERQLLDEIAMLKAGGGSHDAEPREDLVEAVFVEYEMWLPPGRKKGQDEVPKKIPFSPSGYKHGHIYQVPAVEVDANKWWKKPSEDDRTRYEWLKSKGR